MAYRIDNRHPAMIVFWPLLAVAAAATSFFAFAAYSPELFHGPGPFVEQPPPTQTERLIHGTLASLLVAACVWLAWRLLDASVWRSVVRRTGRPAPRMIVDLARVAILVFAVAGTATVVFEQSLDGLFVSSGVLGIVLGLALQHLIADFFSGAALGMESPFRVGQWITVDDVTGQVIEVNWRSTRLVTDDEVMVVVPNSMLAQSRVMNYEMPDGPFQTGMPVSLEYDTPIPDAKRVLLAAVMDAEAPGLRKQPAPDVIVTGFGADGIEYLVRFYLDKYAQLPIAKDAVASKVGEFVMRAGMSIPYPKRDVYFAQMPTRTIDKNAGKADLLARADLLAPLDRETLGVLAGAAKRRVVPAGESVVREGEAGSSLFVVVEGLLEVLKSIEGNERRVATIRPGACFGEMSLLTGEPRSATVRALTECTTLELTKEAVAPVLEAQPEVAESLARIVSDRRAANAAAAAGANAPPPDEATKQGMRAQLLGKIRAFFNLSR